MAKENITKRDLTKTACGTPEYIAPEIILRQGHGHAADWWSLGCIIYEMLIGIPPFYSEERKEIYRNAVQRPVRFSRHINPQAADLISGLLKKDPFERLGSQGGAEIMRHQWFSDVDWQALERKQVKPRFVPNIQGPLDDQYFSETFTKSEIAESPGFEGTYEPSPTFGGFTFMAEPAPCCLEMNFT